MRHYRRELVDAPRIEAEVMAASTIVDLDLRCPICNAEMRWCDGSPEEQYMADGTFTSEELYRCDSCSDVRAYVKQVYAPVKRTVSVERMIWEEKDV